MSIVKPCPVLCLAVMFTGLALAQPESSEQTASFPRPALFPTSWELDFEHGMPQRIVVDVPGRGPQAYWYLTYTVTNNTDSEQVFLPAFELMSEDGSIARSDRGIPAAVFDAIKTREKKPLLEPFHQIGGSLRLGEDQARDGVAIWQERGGRKGRFSIFVDGLSGETAAVKLGDREVILRKQLQLNFHVRGDDVYRGEDPITADDEARAWVMR